MSKRYNLKDFRSRQELTQEEMAEKLGISKSHYVSIELGKVNPSVKVLEKFSKLFEYDDIWQLFKKGE